MFSTTCRAPTYPSPGLAAVGRSVPTQTLDGIGAVRVPGSCGASDTATRATGGAAECAENRYFPVRHRDLRMEPPQGFEPWTYALRVAAPSVVLSDFDPVARFSNATKCHGGPPEVVPEVHAAVQAGRVA